MRLNNFKMSKITLGILPIGGLFSVLGLFFPLNNIFRIIVVSVVVVVDTGGIIIMYQDIKYGVINLKKANIKRWLKDNYKRDIILTIYVIIILSVLMIVELTYALIIVGIIVVIAITCIEIYYRTSIKNLE